MSACARLSPLLPLLPGIVEAATEGQKVALETDDAACELIAIVLPRAPKQALTVAASGHSLNRMTD